MKNLIPISAFIFLILFISACQKTKIPVLTTKTATEVTNYSAFSGGIIEDDKIGTITEKGVCWSTHNNPSINDSYAISTSAGLSFETILTSLSPNTTYYYRAFATNDAGTGYGNVLSIKTGQIIEFSYYGKTIQVYPVDNSKSISWGFHGVVLGANDDVSGMTNTNNIISNAGASAAKVCADVSYMQKTDWYLPARGELNKIFEIKNQFSTNNISDFYWSSTELNDTSAFSQNFNSGEISARIKTAKMSIRCIRQKN